MDISSGVNGFLLLARGGVASNIVSTFAPKEQSNVPFSEQTLNSRFNNTAQGFKQDSEVGLNVVIGAGFGSNRSNLAPDVTYQNVANVPPQNADNQNNSNSLNRVNSGEATEQAEQQKQASKEQAELALIQKQITQLAARDREVRAHEQAHVAAGGQYAGAASYTYERGPDGVNYAVGGEVPIDVSPAATPAQTIEKAQVVKRAALAPAEPSPQDRKVASLASAMEQQARAELLDEQSELKAERDEGAGDNIDDSLLQSKASPLETQNANSTSEQNPQIDQPFLSSRSANEAVNTLLTIQSIALRSNSFNGVA